MEMIVLVLFGPRRNIAVIKRLVCIPLDGCVQGNPNP